MECQFGNITNSSIKNITHNMLSFSFDKHGKKRVYDDGSDGEPNPNPNEPPPSSSESDKGDGRLISNLIIFVFILFTRSAKTNHLY